MKRIQLGNTVFEGKNNVYLLEGEGRSPSESRTASGDGAKTVLVDTGVALADTRDELESGLADHGVAFADVDEVFLTHWHWDHSGLAGEIQAEGGATVRVHEADAPLVAGDEEAIRKERLKLQEKLDAWNLPDEPRHELETFLEGHRDLAGRPADVTPFQDGDTFDVNGRTLEAVHLPGHSAGLTAFVFEGEGEDAGDAGEAFVGDAILPKYTPNVGGADVRVDDPLRRYVESLVRIVECDWDRALPGHRDVIGDPAGRAREIIDHHRERTEKVVDVLQRHGACDAWTVSAHLFGDLETIHILHGPGEAYAHLDHLESHGIAEREAMDYRLVEADPDLDGLFPEP